MHNEETSFHPEVQADSGAGGHVLLTVSQPTGSCMEKFHFHVLTELMWWGEWADIKWNYEKRLICS